MTMTSFITEWSPHRADKRVEQTVWTCFQGCTVSGWWESSSVAIQLFFLWGLFGWGQDRGRGATGRELLFSANSVQSLAFYLLLGFWDSEAGPGVRDGRGPAPAALSPQHTFTKASAVLHVPSPVKLKGRGLCLSRGKKCFGSCYI